MLKRIRLECIGRNVRVPLSYAEFSTESLVRIHILPYLVELKSERALAFELAERPELQSAVGLTNGKIPSRATLWHFRHRNSRAFRTLMIRSLIILALDVDRINRSLPFTMKADLDRPDVSSWDTFDDPQTGLSVTIYNHPAHQRPKVQRSLFLPIPGLIESPEANATERILLYQVLDFPILARWQIGSQAGTLCLIQPSWLKSPYTKKDLGTYFGRDRKTPYTACNVLVVRNENGREEVLLSQRKIGSGAGTYAVPGGKKLPDETLEQCVIRELQEEVGIEYREGRPISVRHEHVPGFPPVRSVGVVATAYRGAPRQREYQVHSKWDWYPISNLPKPLFFPTQWAIEDYLRESFTNLDWSSIEPEEPLPLWRE
jgi:8-oxo-dGTP pyrophosphatase MutT (NUDIX family)